eukprot:835000-Amphidinium_carterae.2
MAASRDRQNRSVDAFAYPLVQRSCWVTKSAKVQTGIRLSQFVNSSRAPLISQKHWRGLLLLT